MNSLNVEHVIKEALELSESDRAFIADQLIASLHGQPSIEIEKAWHDEIEKRVHQIQSGEVQCIPWEVVRERLSKYTNQ